MAMLVLEGNSCGEQEKPAKKTHTFLWLKFIGDVTEKNASDQKVAVLTEYLPLLSGLHPGCWNIWWNMKFTQKYEILFDLFKLIFYGFYHGMKITMKEPTIWGPNICWNFGNLWNWSRNWMVGPRSFSFLGGGFEYLSFSSLFGEDFQFD